MPEEVVILRAYSGPWENASERTGFASADVVLFRDGLVIADVSPIFDVQDIRAVQLEAEELAEVLEAIAEAAPIPTDRASSRNSGCDDAGAQVIRVNLPDGGVEIAIYCLATDIPVVPTGTPEFAVVLSRLLDDLEQLAADRPTVSTDRRLPMVPSAPQTGG